MIVVDTSVWIAATRGPAGVEQKTLHGLIDADEALLALPVRIELLSGIARRDRRAFERALSALPLVRPDEQTWRLVESWVEPAADAGHRFALTDLLIAALASEAGALVWSFDTDFVRMQMLGWIRLYE